MRPWMPSLRMHAAHKTRRAVRRRRSLCMPLSASSLPTYRLADSQTRSPTLSSRRSATPSTSAASSRSRSPAARSPPTSEDSPTRRTCSGTSGELISNLASSKKRTSKPPRPPVPTPAARRPRKSSGAPAPASAARFRIPARRLHLTAVRASRPPEPEPSADSGVELASLRSCAQARRRLRFAPGTAARAGRSRSSGVHVARWVCGDVGRRGVAVAARRSRHSGREDGGASCSCDTGRGGR